MTTPVFALLLLGQFISAPTLEQSRQNAAITFKAHGYELTEAGVIAALEDRRDRITPMNVVLLYESIPKTPAIHYAMIEAFRDEFLIENTYFPSGKEEGAITFMAGALVQLHETGWEDIAMSELPKMGQTTQLNLARDLAQIDRADGWPIVRAAIASNDPGTIRIALGMVDPFDGLPNPIDGGRPIDLVAELHRLAASTPENLKYGIDATWLLKRGDGLDDSRAREKAFLEKGPSSRQEIELKAARIEKARHR